VKFVLHIQKLPIIFGCNFHGITSSMKLEIRILLIGPGINQLLPVALHYFCQLLLSSKVGMHL